MMECVDGLLRGAFGFCLLCWFMSRSWAAPHYDGSCDSKENGFRFDSVGDVVPQRLLVVKLAASSKIQQVQRGLRCSNLSEICAKQDLLSLFVSLIVSNMQMRVVG